MKKILNSVRVAACYWQEDAPFDQFIKWLEKNKDIIEQVSFFTTTFHPPMPLDTAARHCDILKGRMETVKKMGVNCGMNILATVGHHPERLEETLQGDWTYMTNIDGDACLGSRCMNNPAYLEEYVKPLYRLHCAAKPEFIWIDDDVRYGHIPIGYACFCDKCIEAFNRDFHHAFDRASLKAALENQSEVTLRHEWLTHQSGKITNLLRFIRKTVNEVDASITLGFMTGDRFLEGYDFKAWADALSDNGRYEIMWRPGGGAYTDISFEEQLGKSREVGRQSANLPAFVTNIQSEIENCPYQMLKKSPRSTVLEAMMHISTGATGTAWNFLPNGNIGESIELIDPHMQAIKSALPFMKRISAAFGRGKALGIHCGWHMHSQAAVGGSFIRGWGGTLTNHTNELFALGIPECYAFEKAQAFALSGRAPYAFSHEELIKILSGAVLLDAGAMQALNDMGYGEYIGFTLGKEFSEDAEEVYCEHPVNQGIVGKRRSCSPIFCVGQSYSLNPPKGAEILCRLENCRQAPVAECSMGIFRNSLGGTVCVSAYFPYSELSDSQKSAQMKRLFGYLTQNQLSAYVSSYHRIRLIVRELSNGGIGILALNRNLDLLRGVTIAVSGAHTGAILIDEGGKEQALVGTLKGKETLFTIPELQPYQMCLLTLKGE